MGETLYGINKGDVILQEITQKGQFGEEHYKIYGDIFAITDNGYCDFCNIYTIGRIAKSTTGIVVYHAMIQNNGLSTMPMSTNHVYDTLDKVKKHFGKRKFKINDLRV